ncbi:hypothetical protein FRC00_013661 [Tulasnella sp. 408]|nr:hypothetical protein FRC00_013661 [Tulasnella sp. 408]
MATTELSAYTDLGEHSNIVRILECFYDETFHDYRGSFFVRQAWRSHAQRLLESPVDLVLEAATTDLSRFVNLLRPRSQADLRTAASVWTKSMVSAVHVRRISSLCETIPTTLLNCIPVKQHLHNLGMSHRDMKPSNVLVFLTESGLIDVKLADFGLVRLQSQRVETDVSLSQRPF